MKGKNSKIKNMPKFKDHLNELMSDKAFKKEYFLQAKEFDTISAIISMRISKNISQKELARRLGTKQSAISRFESGAHSPSLDLLYRLADALGVKIKIQFK